MRVSSFTNKIVVNVQNGKELGVINDLKIDFCTGKIYCIIVSDLCSIKKCHELEIPWSKICKIGEDVILVDICDLGKKG